MPMPKSLLWIADFVGSENWKEFRAIRLMRTTEQVAATLSKEQLVEINKLVHKTNVKLS